MLTLYSKPNCPACDMLKRRLSRQELEFDVVDVSTDEVAYSRIVSKGFRSVPVIALGNDFASGSHLGDQKLLQIIQHAKEQQDSNILRM